MNTSELNFCLIRAAADVVAENVASTPAGMRPTLGAIALLRWKPTTWACAIVPSDQTATGSVTVRLFAAEKEVASHEISLAGPETVSFARSVDLAEVLGDAPLSVRVDIDSAAESGVTLEVQSRLEIHQLTAGGSGCLS